MTDKHQVNADNAELFWEWLRNRGGIAIWRSVNLSNPGASWSTPALTDDNPPKPYSKPTWQSSDQPSRIITDPTEVEVYVAAEVKRFHVAVRRSSSGMMLKVSDGGSRRIRSAVAKAGDGAYHVFDYETQEAVIMKPVSTVPLVEWIAQSESLKRQKST